eukprot:15334412-Ditylum_brightwellii.AAC.1
MTVTLSRHISSSTLCYKDPSTNFDSVLFAFEKGGEESVFIALLPIKRGEQHTRRDKWYATRTTVFIALEKGGREEG